MTLSRSLVITFFTGLTNLLCRIDKSHLDRVPAKGPLILVTNHVNILEVPLVYVHLQPRPVTGFTLATRWDAAWTRWILNAVDAIPLRSGEADYKAMREAIQRLAAGEIVGVAPEGTRSYNGKLQKAHAGVVLLALHSGAPLQPLVIYGHEGFPDTLRHLQRTDFHIRVGKTFYLDPHGEKVTHEIRNQMLDEVMFQLATLLPPLYRGVYADLSSATEKYLDFQVETV
ncbi:MAG: 1-acyl-sn-glycerol-3-phosphate acyltransferase [Anaerolineales bacterium]|nr:1-acyl-sn-glycerol-3-phosphate acyltransferase [Anaerolineales bacterium]